jgi:hypothetical protein
MASAFRYWARYVMVGHKQGWAEAGMLPLQYHHRDFPRLAVLQLLHRHCFILDDLHRSEHPIRVTVPNATIMLVMHPDSIKASSYSVYLKFGCRCPQLPSFSCPSRSSRSPLSLFLFSQCRYMHCAAARITVQTSAPRDTAWPRTYFGASVWR